jgi:8-oxo-dGTP pyrophosphatase MutT (NUDIX family)
MSDGPERAAGRKSARPRARRERSAGGVVYRMANGVPLYLLIRDSYGNWGFPKGHLERGERAGTAALREVMEETGLRALRLVAPIETIDWHFRFRGALIHKRCDFFLMETDAERTKPQRAEGITACRWTPAAQAIELLGYENARAVMRRAHEMVAGGATRDGDGA